MHLIAISETYLIVALVASGFSVASISNTSTLEALVSLHAERGLSIGIWSLSIYVQVSVSLLLAWKIWRTGRIASSPRTDRRGYSVMWIILESGAALSLTMCVLLALYVDERTSGEVVIAALGQIDVSVIASSIHSH